jgi:putative transposase
LVWRRGVEAFRTEEYGAPRSIVTDGLRAYSAAMNEIGVAAERHEIGGRLNNRAENSHQLFRRQERAMHRFRSARTLQKFSSVHAQVHNQFNQERHLVTRQVYKQRRSAALAEWRALLRHRSPLARWRSRCKSTSLRYFDTAIIDASLLRKPMQSCSGVDGCPVSIS